jgi:6-phosphogluconolactonase (cycloisomerase 2 family)
MPSLARGAVALLAVAGGLVFAGSAAAAPDPVVGHVYVDANTKPANTITGFDRHADGTLTPIPGSPFPAGGAGTGTSLASQGAVQVSGDGRYLIAVDAGSNQISVLRIHHDGTLRLVPGSVVSSGGAEPVSLTEHDGLVYVANAGSDAANYTAFVLSRAGKVRPLAGSTFALPADAQPGDVLFNGTGQNLVGARVGSSEIDSFRVAADGRLIAASGSPFAAQGPGPFGSEFRPTDPSQLFVSNAHGGAGNGTVSAFSVASDGGLTSIGASPFADQQTAPCWVEITHDGRYLFTVNTASGSVSRYAIASDGALSLLGSTAIPGPSGAGTEDARLSPDGRDLYVNEAKAGLIGEYTVEGGDLSSLGVVPVSTGAGAAGLATN